MGLSFHEVFLFVGLTEFATVFADDEYRTGSCAHDTLGCAANAEMFPSGVTVGCDHNQVGVGFPGSLDDFVGWNAETDCANGLPSAAIASRNDHGAQIFLRLRQLCL